MKPHHWWKVLAHAAAVFMGTLLYHVLENVGTFLVEGLIGLI